MHPLNYLLPGNAPPPVAKVYIVSTRPGCMAGIESLQIITVPPAGQASFLKQYKNCIIMEGSSVEEVKASFNELLK